MQSEHSNAAPVKRCSRCGETKPVSQFYARGGGRSGFATYCKACHRAYYRGRWYAPGNATQRLHWTLRSRYRLAIGQYVGMAIRQGGRCAICGHERRLVVDHSHATGAVRGLLCVTCNAAIAILDDPHWLSRALSYLAGVCA